MPTNERTNEGTNDACIGWFLSSVVQLQIIKSSSPFKIRPKNKHFGWYDIPTYDATTQHTTIFATFAEQIFLYSVRVGGMGTYMIPLILFFFCCWAASYFFHCRRFNLVVLFLWCCYLLFFSFFLLRGIFVFLFFLHFAFAWGVCSAVVATTSCKLYCAVVRKVLVPYCTVSTGFRLQTCVCWCHTRHEKRANHNPTVLWAPVEPHLFALEETLLYMQVLVLVEYITAARLSLHQ